MSEYSTVALCFTSLHGHGTSSVERNTNSHSRGQSTQQKGQTFIILESYKTIMDLSGGGGGFQANRGNSTWCNWDVCRPGSTSPVEETRYNGAGSLQEWSQFNLGSLLNRTSLRDGTTGKEVNVEGNEVDEIAHALNNLSFEQRERAYDDLHGISSTDAPEDPEMVEQSLRKFDEILQKRLQNEILRSSSSSASALQLAMDQDPTYLAQESFRESFLRAEDWNVKGAVDRLISFLEQKKELFGSEKLTKDIMLDDLDEDDMEALESGGLQVVPLKDQSGRQLMIAVPQLEEYRTPENLVSLVSPVDVDLP